ncbi:MAG: hypothetical protein ACU0BN_09120 [Sulfitobacter sp.]
MDFKVAEQSKKLAEILTFHLKVPADEVDGMAERFLEFKDMPILPFYDGPKDLESLGKLSQAISQIDQSLRSLSPSARRQLNFRLRSGTSKEDMDWIKFMAKNDEHHLELLKNVEGEAKVLRRMVHAAQKDIENSDRSRDSLSKIKVDRLQVTQLATMLWRKRRKEELRSDIDESHPFAGFLQDLIWLFEIDSTPRAAYRAWLRQKTPSPLQPG